MGQDDLQIFFLDLDAVVLARDNGYGTGTRKRCVWCSGIYLGTATAAARALSSPAGAATKSFQRIWGFGLYLGKATAVTRAALTCPTEVGDALDDF